MQVLAPDKAAIEVQVGERGPIYKARDGVLDVPDGHARAIVRGGGSYRMTGFSAARGFVCRHCGFRALIRTCGRCGATDLEEESQ